MLRVRPLLIIAGVLLVLCGVGLRGVRSQSGTLRRITNTSEEGLSLNPSLSGDGRHLAFESTVDLAGAGGSDRFRALRADLNSNPALFTQMGAMRAVAPALSQDGSRITFASKDNPLGKNGDGNSEIFLFDGASLRQITETSPGDLTERVRNGNFQPSMTDDGRFILFTSNRNFSNLNPDANLEVFIYGAASQGFTKLTNTSSTVGATDAKIRRDGSRFAYIGDSGAAPSSSRDLVLQDRLGGSMRVIVSNAPGLALTYGRAISDDGLRVVYSADLAPNQSQVFLFDGRNNITRQITSLSTRADDIPLHPTISGDGTRITFATRRNVAGLNTDGSVELYLFDIPTGQFSRVTTAPANATAYDGSLRIAEIVSSLNDDGSLVAFNFPRVLSGPVASANLANNSEIYVATTGARPTFATDLTVLNGASFGREPATTKAIAPHSIAVALGNALANTTEQAQRQPDGTFPLALGGTTVTVNNRLAPIFYVSPTQVNFLVPPETETGPAQVVVTNPEGFQTRGTVTVLRAAPGIFTQNGDGTGEGVILDADTLQRGPFDPTGGTRHLIIFATGVRNASQVSVTIGGRPVTVESLMASPDMPGMDEVHILLPADLRGAGLVNLVLRADNRESNPVTLTLTGEARRDILINEILADPPDGLAGDANHDGVRDASQDEFIELVNSTTRDIDISGYKITTRSSSATSDTERHTFAPGTIFPGGTAIVVFGGGAPSVNDPAFGGAQIFTANGSSSSLSLSNTGGVVTLLDATGAIANLLAYGGATGLNANADQSLTRAPDITGGFTLHRTASGSGDRAFSPGTRLDGTPFIATPAIARIEVTPSLAAINTGGQQQFTARAFAASGQELTGVIYEWRTSAPAVATIDQNGLATGRAVGTTEIRASARGVQSVPATLNVSRPQPAITRIEVTPATASIIRGGTQQFNATAFNQNNQPITGATFNWTSTRTAVATVDAGGLARGVGIGTTTVTATTSDGAGGTVSGVATLIVEMRLLINEVLADVPPDNPATIDIEGDANRDGVRNADDDEFIELFNLSNTSVDISGVIVADSTSNRFTFPANTILAAGGAVVIFGGGSPPSNDPAFGGALIVKASSLGLNDAGDTVTVKLPVGGEEITLAQLTYGSSSTLTAPNDQSLTRSPDAEIATGGGNYIAHSVANNAASRVYSPGTRADGTPFGSPPITRISISPSTATIIVGQAQSFTARAFSNASGTEVEVQNVSFIWDSSDSSKATVTRTTGLSTTASSIAAGSTTIRARAGGQQGTAALTVNPLPITRIEITPLSATILVGGTQQFAARAFDQNNQEVSGVTFTWASSNANAATIDQNGLATGTGAGTTQITASARGVTSNTATLTVNPRVLTRIEVTPSTARVPPGAQQQFTARAFDQNNQEITGVTFMWTSSDPNVATIDQNGLATVISVGTTTINVSAQNVTGSATLNVVPPAVVINEVLADPPDGSAGDANHDGVRSGADDEFIELANATNTTIDISGWSIRTRSLTGSTETQRHIFATGTTLPANDALAVFGGGSFDLADPTFGGAQVFKASTGGLSLTNSGLTIIIRDAQGVLITLFTYGGTTGLNGDSDQSLTRSPDITGNYIRHTEASGAGGRRFSPGIKVDGSFFAPRVGRLMRVTIAPASASVHVNQTTQFTAQALDQYNRPLAGVSITFASSDTNVATIESTSTDASTGIAAAVVRGRNTGSAQIRASATDGMSTRTSNPAQLTVTPEPPRATRVEVTPASATINRGAAQQFSAAAFDQNNQIIPNASFTWSSSNPAVATVDGNGLARGVGLGTISITATTANGAGGSISGQANLTVQVPLIINEILADPPNGSAGDANRDGTRSGTQDEFVEIVNDSNAPVDISGVIVADAASNRYTFPSNTTLAARRAVVIFGGGAPPADPSFGGALIVTAGSSGLGLDNSGDTVTIKLPVASVDVSIATSTYGTEGSDNQSLTRSPDLTGSFTKHTSVQAADNRLFSPGTRVDGTPFGSPTITRILVSPASASINVGSTQAFTARAFSDGNGPEIEVQNVSFVWDSSDPGKAALAPVTGASTTATGIAAGNTTIRARAGGQQGTAALTVNAVVTAVELTPDSATITTGSTATFTATARDTSGNVVPDATFSFSLRNASPANAASISSTTSNTVTVRGDNAGSVVIVASYTRPSDGATLEDSSHLTINPPPPRLTRIEVMPSSATIAAGMTQQFTARAFDQNNQEISSVTFTWASSDMSVATIDQNGLATGITAGTTQITASAENVTSNPATLTVTPPPVPTAGQVIINEALVAFSTSSTQTRNDFLELYNTTSQTLDISGLVISFRPSGSGNTPNTITLPGAVGSATTLIGPKNYFLIVNGAETFGATADFNAGSLNFDLNNTTGGIRIEINGVKLDGLSYQGGSTPPASPFNTYGEGAIFTFTSGATNDLIRSPNATDTNNNQNDFRRNGATASVTPRNTNP